MYPCLKNSTTGNAIGVYEQNSIEKIARFCKTETTKDALMGCVKDKSSGLECLFNFQHMKLKSYDKKYIFCKILWPLRKAELYPCNCHDTNLNGFYRPFIGVDSFNNALDNWKNLLGFQGCRRSENPGVPIIIRWA